MGPRGSLGKDALLTMTAQGASLVCGMATSVITARALGPAGRGVVALVVLTVGLVGWVVPLSAESGLMYYVSRRRASVGSALTAAVAMGAVTGAIGLLVVWGLSAALASSALRGVPRSLLLLAGAGLAFGTFTALTYAAILGAGWVRERTALCTAGAVLGLILTAVFVLGLRMGVTGAVLAGLLVPIVMSGAVVIWLGRRVRMPRRVDLGLVRASVLFGLKMHPGLVAYWANLSLDRLIVNYFLGAYAVGLYGVAGSLGELMWQIPAAIAIALLPRAVGSDSATGEAAARAARLATALVALGCAGTAAVAPLLVPALFGREFSPAVPALLMLLPGVIMFTPGKVLTAYLIAQGHQQAMSYASGAGLAVTLALDMLLIPRWGIVGAAAASTAAYGVTSAVNTAWFLRVSMIGMKDVTLVRLEDFCSLIALVRGAARRLVRAAPGEKKVPVARAREA